MTSNVERERQSSESYVLENVNNNKKTFLPEKRNNDKNPNDSTYENHRYVVIGPSNFGKTYYMLKMLEKTGNQRPFHMITRSSNQYQNYKTSNETKPINKYKGSVVTFDSMLGVRNSSQIDEFYTRGRHKGLSEFYVSQSYFALPRQSIRNNSDRLILFKQKSRYVQSM